MVVKTNLCAFSEMKIYPGHGRNFVARSGQLVLLLSSKVCSMFHQRKKSAKLMWTQAWRRMHKKINVETSSRKRARKVVKVVRAPSGITKEEFAVKIKPKMDKPQPVPGAPKSAVLEQASVAEAKKKRLERMKANKAKAAAAPKAASAKHAGKGR